MGSFYMEATQINYRRDETVKTVDQKLQELSQESAIDTDIAPVFKSTITYAPGDMVYYRNKLYVFNVAHSGAWAAGDVTATNVTTAIKNAAAVKADEADIAPAFDATASYSAGDLVYYGGIIYRCTNDHSGDWDADDFSETTITGELASLKSGLTNYERDNNWRIEAPERKNHYDSSVDRLMYNANSSWWINSGTNTLDAGNERNYTWAVKCNPNTTYTVSLTHTSTTFRVAYGKMANLTWVTTDNTPKNIYGLQSNSETGDVSITITTGSDATYLFIQIGSSDADTAKLTMQVEIGDTKTAYAPYVPSVESRLDLVERGKISRFHSISTINVSGVAKWCKIATVTVDSSDNMLRYCMLGYNGFAIGTVKLKATPTLHFNNDEISITRVAGASATIGIKVSDDFLTAEIYVKTSSIQTTSYIYTVLSEGGDGRRFNFTDPVITDLTDADMTITG